MSPAEGPFIDTDLATGLIEAEAAAKNDPGNAENWIAYARKLLHLPRVFDAQVTAETAALIAMETDSSLTDTANLIRLQAMVNRLEFDQAARLGRQIIDKDPIFINQMDFLNAYISSHALAGDIEAAITQVYALIIQEPSLYGGHAAMIELLRIQRQEQPFDSARIAALISDHRKKLTEIYHQFSRKLEPAMGSYIEKLVKGGAA